MIDPFISGHVIATDPPLGPKESVSSIEEDLLQQICGQYLVHDDTTEKAVPLISAVICLMVPVMNGQPLHIVHTTLSFGSCVPTSFGLSENCDLDFKKSN